MYGDGLPIHMRGSIGTVAGTWHQLSHAQCRVNSEETNPNKIQITLCVVRESEVVCLFVIF